MSAIHIFSAGRNKHCDINMTKILSSVEDRTCPKNVRFPITNNIFLYRVIARVLHMRLHLVLWRCEITNHNHKKTEQEGFMFLATMENDWVTIYVIVVLSISAVPLVLLVGWSIALCLEEMKNVRILRRNEYEANVRAIVTGASTFIMSQMNQQASNDNQAKATTHTCECEHLPNEIA